ncbi:hypothetical protein C8R44DRAFT_737080 [Mycena epipterygia]|nr:hypothetical protein C8R44DRAFT_737080 [Mycena epipterygia]
MFDFSRLVALVTTAASLASATVTILDFNGKSLNVDLNAGAVDYAPVNTFPPGNALNEQWIFVPQDAAQTTFKIQNAWVPRQYLPYASFGSGGNGHHSQLVLRQNASATVFTQKALGMGLVKSVIPSFVSPSAPSSVYIDALLSFRAETLSSPPGPRQALRHPIPLPP